MKLLLIDDDEVDRKNVRRALAKTDLSAEVSEAVDSQSALAMFDSNKFHCVLLDYRLPGSDGLAVAREMLSRNSDPEVPIIMLTGEGSESVAVEAMKVGVQDYLPKATIDSELLGRTIKSAIDKVTLQAKIVEMNKTMQQMAFKDSLTGLGNRNLFNDRIEALIATCRRNKEPFSLMLMDLNKFKEINDNYGHEAGDFTLREVGRRLKELGRDADGFFRLGGDEFAALISTGVSHDGAEIMANKIIEALRIPVDYDSHSLEIGISIGIVFFPNHSDDHDTLMRLADAAMYEAKRGKHGYTVSAIPTSYQKLT